MHRLGGETATKNVRGFCKKRLFFGKITKTIGTPLLQGQAGSRYEKTVLAGAWGAIGNCFGLGGMSGRRGPWAVDMRFRGGGNLCSHL